MYLYQVLSIYYLYCFLRASVIAVELLKYRAIRSISWKHFTTVYGNMSFQERKVVEKTLKLVKMRVSVILFETVM